MADRNHSNQGTCYQNVDNVGYREIILIQAGEQDKHNDNGQKQHHLVSADRLKESRFLLFF